MKEKNRDPNSNQYQGQDKTQDTRQPGQAGGDKIPGKERNPDQNPTRSNHNQEEDPNE